MSTASPETPTTTAADQSDRDRFNDILLAQRASFLRAGAPTLAQRRTDLKRFGAALLGRRRAIEEAINADYLERNLRRFMRPSRRHIALHQRGGAAGSNTSRSAWSG
jgi:coniferyl-aldehyde dehydrogenase